MKKITLSFILLLISYFSFGQCQYTLRMEDSYGDGWGGNTMDVLVNGVVEVDDATLNTGFSSNLTFTVNDTDEITTVWNGGGTYGYETSYKILDTTSEVVGSASEEDISTPIIASCPSCLPPTSLATANISSSSVDITWTSSETSFNIEVVDITSGETADGSIDYTSSTNSYSPTSLSANNDYEVYVQADCGADDTSSWVGPVSFTTLCPAIVPDYTADMSNNPVDNCWKEANNGDAASGPTDLGSGLWYSSNHNGISSNAINLWQNVRSDWIISPSFDLSSSAPSELNVYVALTENSTLGSNADLGSDDSVSLLMTVDGGTTWTSLQTWTQGNVPTDIGEQITYDLSTITGTVQFAFLGDEGDLDDDEDVYFHVSQFRVRETPSCLEVSGLTTANITSSSAVLSWTADASQSLFNVEVVDVTDGESVTGTPTHSSVTNPFTLTGLTANNDYEFYVQADCGGSDTSAWAGPVSFTTLCEAFDVPYTENFDSTSTGTTSNPTVPNCWSFIDGGSGYGYVSSTGANSFYFYNLSDTSGDYILVSPETNALSSGTNRVSFDVDGSMSQDLIVGTLSDPDDSSTFTAIETITLATNNYESYVVNIPAGTDSYIGFKHGQTGTYDSYYLDNIAVIPQPSCLEVSDVVATTLATGFDLSWTAGGIEPAWNIEYGFTGFTQGSGTTIVSSSTSATISGLLSNTSYDIYVQADCGDGDTGAWIGPLTVITNATCGDTLYDSGGSTGSYADDELTIVTVSPTNSGDLVTLTFNSFNTESGYDKMWVYNGPDTTGEVLLNGVSGSSIPDAITSSHTTGSLTVKFDSDGSTTAAGYEIAVTCAAQPTCMLPSELSISSITDASAIFGWISNGSEMAWNIEYGPSGFTQGAGTIVVANENPYTFLDLLDNTGYDVYIQADCGVDGMSDWAGPVNFTTEPAPIVPNYTNDFSTFPGEFWSEGSGALNAGPAGSTSSWVADGFGNSGTTGAARINLYDTKNEWLISPTFDLSSGTFYLNVDAAATEYASTAAANFGADDIVILLASTDNGVSWEELYEWNATTDPGPTGTGLSEITLENYTATSKFAFYGNATSPSFSEDVDFFVDNFQITSTSLGIEENNISLFNYFPNPVNDVLTIKAQKDVDNITVYNMLGQVVKRQSPNTRDCTVDLSAMQTGAYFVQVSIDNSVETVRILKN